MNNIYFQNCDCVLYLGDSFKILKRIPKSSVDVVFSDPPYYLSNGGVSCHSGKQVCVNKAKWDSGKNLDQKLSETRKWLRLCRNILKDDGTIWISGTLHNIYIVGYALELEGFSIINNIIWEKPNPAPNLACRCFTNSTETILWARKQLTKTKKGHHFFNYDLMKSINGGKQHKDVWKICPPRKSEKRYGKHPTQKPEELMAKIILASSREGDTILDPFCGSGTTGVEAVKFNRKFIGIDNEESYLSTAKKRISDIY